MRFNQAAKLVPIVLVIAATIAGATCLAQQPATNTVEIPQLLAQLQSNQWADRAKAYEQLSSNSQALSESEVQSALLDLLDRENKLIESVNRDLQGSSVDEKYGEDYAEYVAALGGTVDSFANWNDPHQVCIFVREPYLPESRFAAKIASHAKVAVPCLIQMYSSDVGLTRAEAAPVLVQALAKAGSQLDSSTAAKVKQTILTALNDSDEAVRSFTVDALGKFGGVDMIPALAKVAETDPSPEVQGYSIRKSATQAIAAIQKRTGQR